jgi:CRISPR-associated protein Cas2
MKKHYLVCYDIREPHRLQRVCRTLKGYGERWQYSIFFCSLKPIDRVRLESDLKTEMNLADDRAIIIDLGTDENTAREAITVIGQPLPPQQLSIDVI